jgi:hypothetical protein
MYRIETPNLSDMCSPPAGMCSTSAGTTRTSGRSSRRTTAKPTNEKRGMAPRILTASGTGSPHEDSTTGLLLVRMRLMCGRFWYNGAHVFGKGCYFAEQIGKARGYANGLLFYCKATAAAPTGTDCGRCC